MIPQEFIEEVQQKTDIVDLISSYIPLKRAGRNFKAQCPFHNEKTPSFFVNPQKQIFHCFGCGEGGGALQFLMLYDKLSFPEAVEVLAKRLGMQIPYQKVSAKDKIKTRLYDVVQEASQFFHKSLLSMEEALLARNYLDKRGITKGIIANFNIGYAPGNNMLIGYMRKRGVTLDILEKASLVVSKTQGGYRDLFRGRIMFPIYDIRHRVVGFGARRIKDKEGVPKYINSFENPLYSKREHLFGLNFSKDEIIKKDSAIVTEGYMDMIVPFTAGIKNIVASLGTALTPEQIRLIKRYTSNIILIFDSDKAGEGATLRAVDLLIENGLNIKIVHMPKGFDLDLATREKGTRFVKALLDKQTDFFDYKIEILRSLYDPDSIEGKVKIAEHMLSTISRLNSEIEKYEYIKKLSAVLRIKETVFIAELRKADKGFEKNRGAPQVNRPNIILPMAEKMLLRAVFSSDKVLAALEKRISAEDFSHPLARKTFSLVSQHKVKNGSVSRSFVSSILDKEVAGFVSQIMMEDMGKIDKNILKDCILRLRSNRIKTIKEKLRNEIRQAEDRKDSGRVKSLMNEFQKINSEAKNG